MKSTNLKVIFKLQGSQQFKQRYAGMSMAELLKAVWKFDICLCPECGHAAMKQLGRCYVSPSWYFGFSYTFWDLPPEGLRSMPKNGNCFEKFTFPALQGTSIFCFYFLGRMLFPYGIQLSPANWYNRKESHSEQLIFCVSCSFLTALNLILSLGIIPYVTKHVNTCSILL